MLSKDILDRAVEFHGHLGPFLVLGLRAGLLGTRQLGRSYSELNAIVETGAHPPSSCFIDGVQFASSCTTGKGNLEVRISRNVSVEFIRGERKIRLAVKEQLLRTLNHLSSEKEAEALSRELIEKADDELFLINAD